MKIIYKFINQLFIVAFISIIRLYQILISPLMGSNCRFLPTCSEFAIDAIRTYGLIKGVLISFKRISSCHPYGKQGYDPIIKENKKN